MKKLLILAGVVALTCSSQVFAQETGVQEGRKPCPIEAKKHQPPKCKTMVNKPKCDFKKLEDELQLTDKQKEQAKQLREKQREAAKPIFEQLKTKDQEVQALHEQLRELRVQNKKEFEAILTDKQLKKLNEIKAERKKEFAKRHHNGAAHRRPPMPPEKRCEKNTIEE